MGVLRHIASEHPDLRFRIITGVSAGAINATFLAMAVEAGLTSAIANPLAESVRVSILATDVLMARDTFAGAWIGYHRRPEGG